MIFLLLSPGLLALTTLLANATGRRICRGNMAGASPATTMIRLGKPMHSCHGSGTPCGDPVWETGNHARLHSIFHSPAESLTGRFFNAIEVRVGAGAEVGGVGTLVVARPYFFAVHD